MASLSQASFATPNTQQLSSSRKLLPSHLSMKPNAKLSYNQLHTMRSFNDQYGISSPLYEGYSEAGDSVDQSFTGGDDPLLTSSWEALDKLVSASMTSSDSGIGNELPTFAHSSAQGSTLQSMSPISMTAVEQKPTSVLNSVANQKGGVWNVCDNQGSAYTSSRVGLSLASLISADPGLVERAAKFSSYSQQAYCGGFNNQCANNFTKTNNALTLENLNLAYAREMPSVRAAKALSSQCPLLLKGANVAMEIDAKSDITARKPSSISTPTTMETKQSISSQRSMGNICGPKKRREGVSKDGEVDDGGANVPRKRAKGGERNLGEKDISISKNSSKVGRVSGDDQKLKTQQSAGLNSAELEHQSRGGSNETECKSLGSNTTAYHGPSAPQAPKPDFIHVRARRGQATDSHSLAERVRREKISERMKYLQDLVPGCTKLTGKAMMLDEIINYVQSLQRQVEFLSMKLAAVHPSKLEFNFESLFGKEVVHQSIVQNNQCVPYAPETLAHLKPYPLLHETVQHLQPHHQVLPADTNPSSCMQSYDSDAALRRTLSMLASTSSDTFGDRCLSSQITDSWDEDFHSLAQLGLPQIPLNVNSRLHGASIHDQRKMSCDV